MTERGSRQEAFVAPDNLAALATARELGCAGIAVTVLAHRRGPAARSRFVEFAQVPDLYRQPSAWAAEVARLAAARPKPPVFFPTEDAALIAAEHEYETLASAVRFSYAAPGVVPNIVDKRRLYATARSLGIATPSFLAIDSRDRLDRIPSDWMVKPACRYWLAPTGEIRTFLTLSGGSKAISQEPGRAAARILEAGFPVLAQERIPGAFEELVSVGLYVDRSGQILAAFCARKHCEYPEPFGDGLVVEAISDPGIGGAAADLLKACGYWGVCDVEFKRDPRDGQFKLLDANPRVWLWHGLGAACGSPLALTAYCVASGQRPPAYPPNGARHPTWVSPRGCLAFLLTSYRPKRHGLGLPARLTVGALRTILRDLKTFRDPLYLRPSAWRAFASEVGSRLHARWNKHVADGD
ncbi:MAG: hypothetical protein D6815_00505 [Candidatus Dadabacteria bacterium]|nr:MAG: hypothetical protein D6815_00505 [Candidatus Dadabacteria bacterium]